MEKSSVYFYRGMKASWWTGFGIGIPVGLLISVVWDIFFY